MGLTSNEFHLVSSRNQVHFMVSVQIEACDILQLHKRCIHGWMVRKRRNSWHSEIWTTIKMCCLWNECFYAVVCCNRIETSFLFSPTLVLLLLLLLMFIGKQRNCVFVQFPMYEKCQKAVNRLKPFSSMLITKHSILCARWICQTLAICLVVVVCYSLLFIYRESEERNVCQPIINGVWSLLEIFKFQSS